LATIVIAVFLLIFSSLFFGIQTMPQLFKLNSTGKKFFWGFLIFFLLAPCFILVFYYIIRQYEFNIWSAAPLIFVSLMWLATGFLTKVAYKTLTEENPKRKRVTFTPADIKKRYKLSVLFLVLAVVIWVLGLTVGFGSYDVALVILCIYFILQAIAFILGNRKAVADGNVKEPETNSEAETKESAKEKDTQI
jgi:hypothetical protein